VIASFIPLAVFAIADRIFGRRSAVVAGLISAVYPFFILYSNTLHTEGLLVLLLCLLIIFLLRFASTRRLRDIAVAAVIAGLGCLARPTVLVLIPVFALWVLIIARRDLKLAVRSAAVFVLLAVVLIAPWTYRNYLVHGKLIPICSRGGVSLWLGNNKWATGNLGVDNERLVQIMPDPGIEDEVESAKYFQQEALRFIRANPGRSMVLGVKKVFHFWRPEGFRFPGLVDRTPFWVRFVVGFFSYMPLFVLFAVGCLMLLRQLRFLRDPGLLLFTLMVLTFTVLHGVFPSIPRYRQPVEPIIIIVASWALVAILDRLRPQGRPEQAA
jgi:4-amino-4-deoxy-L-arabinose transferase-like glycosyltransferase